MANNRDIDKLIVQKVFEMSQAGNSHMEIGDFFHRSRRWAQNILHNYSNERRVKFSWILKSPPDTFSSPTCNKWKWNKPKWKHKFCDIQPNIQQNTIPKLKGAILNAAEMTCRKVNKPGCATVRNQVTALFSLPMRLGQHVLSCHSQSAFSANTCYLCLN